MGELILILGPMKSGKSFELISYFAPLKYTEIPFALFTSAKNTRDKNIWSRDGLELEAKKIRSFTELEDINAQVIGVDEVHMFEGEDTKPIEQLLKQGKTIVMSGLSTGHQGKMFDVVTQLIELGPREIIYKRAVCETCKKPDAVYTQIFDKNGQPVVLEQKIVPDDGTYTYRVACRNCYIR